MFDRAARKPGCALPPPSSGGRRRRACNGATIRRINALRQPVRETGHRSRRRQVGDADFAGGQDHGPRRVPRQSARREVRPFDQRLDARRAEGSRLREAGEGAGDDRRLRNAGRRRRARRPRPQQPVLRGVPQRDQGAGPRSRRDVPAHRQRRLCSDERTTVARTVNLDGARILPQSVGDRPDDLGANPDERNRRDAARVPRPLPHQLLRTRRARAP